MANATVTRQLKDVVTTKRVRNGVALGLSNEEAIALRSLLGKVNGSPDCTARHYTEPIYVELGKADVPRVSSIFDGGVRAYAGSLDVVVNMAKDLEEQ